MQPLEVSHLSGLSILGSANIDCPRKEQTGKKQPQTFEEASRALFNELLHPREGNERLSETAVGIFSKMNFVFDEKSYELFKTSLYDIITNKRREQDLDDLIQLLYCDVLMTRLVDPVLLSSGHTVDRSVVMGLENASSQPVDPFTRELLQYRDDPITPLLQSCLRTARQESMQITSETIDACKSMEGQGCFSDDHLLWQRLMGALIPQGSYFVRKKNDNHYVLVGRLNLSTLKKGSPIENLAQSHNIIQISFYFDEDGKVRLMAANVMERFENLEELIKKELLCNDLRPLAQDEKENIEKVAGKEAFLANVSLGQCDARSKTMKEISSHLELRLSEQQIKDKSKNYKAEFKNSVFCRSSANPCTFPCFTAVGFNDKSEMSDLKRMAIVNGEIVHVSSARCSWGRDGQYYFQMGSVVKSESQLDENVPHEKAIKEEFQKLIQHYSNINVIFYLKESPDVVDYKISLVPSSKIEAPKLPYYGMMCLV